MVKSDDNSFDLINDPLLAVLVAAARAPVFPTQKRPAYAAVDTVIVEGASEVDQIAAGLGHVGSWVGSDFTGVPGADTGTYRNLFVFQLA
jgi:hypothetical protein